MERLSEDSVVSTPCAGKTTAKVDPSAPGIFWIFIKITVQYVFMCAVMLLSAGTLRWVRAWIYLAIALICFFVNALVLRRNNPRLIAERHKKHEDTKPFDKRLTALIAITTLVMFIVAGLDAVRYRWSSMAALLLYPGVFLHILGMVVLGWAMSANPFVEKTVRIQTDRNQRVISTGPYAIVRHPMYTGMILIGIGYPLIAGSAWSLLPLFVYIGLFVLRTVLEDRTLQAELPGYGEYLRITRYRLLPYVW